MKKRFLVILYILVLLTGCSSSNSSPIDPGWTNPADGKEKQLVVMSYNIRHCAPYYGTSENTAANVNNVAEVLKKFKPDVVFMQEVDKNTTRSLGIDQAKKLAELVGYPFYQFYKMQDYQGGEYGIAILSALQLKDVKNHVIPSDVEGTAITGNNILGTAKIEFNGVDICLANTHLSVYQADRDKQLPYMLNEILSKQTGPVLFAGDFNATPSNLTIQQLDNAGYFRTNTDPKKFTIPSNAPNRELDYISYKPAKNFEVISHTVQTGISASDHLPILSVLNILKP